MKPLVEKYDHLLIFPARDEGMEDSQNIIYLGSTPYQQVIPAARWALDKLNAKRLFFIGLDGLWGHISHELVRDTINKFRRPRSSAKSSCCCRKPTLRRA